MKENAKLGDVDAQIRQQEKLAVLGKLAAGLPLYSAAGPGRAGVGVKPKAPLR
jgi:hypothetical protein